MDHANQCVSRVATPIKKWKIKTKNWVETRSIPLGMVGFVSLFKVLIRSKYVKFEKALLC